MPSGVYTRTKELREEMSKRMKNNVFPNFTMKNKHHSDESKIKMSSGHIGKPSGALGRKRSEETRKKISLSQKGKSGRNKGKHWKLTKEFGEKVSKRVSGENNPSWMGGKSFEKYGFDWKESLRESIRQRDNYTCQIPECGKKQEELIGFHKKHSVHHIDYNKKNLDPKNLITLCISCHMKTNHNREKWIEYFNK